MFLLIHTLVMLADQLHLKSNPLPYLVCLINLSAEYKNVKNDEIQKEIEKINKNLSKIEKIKKYFIIKNQFTIENNMMTPTLKLKRYKIIKTYQNELEKLFN